MKRTVEMYIKKLLSLGIMFFGTLYALMYVQLEIVLPFALLIFSFLISGITGTKPPYLFGMQKVDTFITKKGGFWNLFRIILILFGFLYDIIIWEIWGIYVIFEIIIDIFLLIKEILFWIIHAFIWFLKLFVPPLIFLYKMFIHYLIKWIWWIYQLTVKHVAPSVKLNYFLVSLWGAIIALFSIFLFYYISVLTEIDGLFFIGCILAVLPIAWSYGEISSINENNLEKEPYYEVTGNFENGFEAVKYVLYYVVAFFVLFLILILLGFFGWIPNGGLTFLGITINISTFISLVMLFLLVMIIAATAIIPAHLLKTEEQETPFHDIVAFLREILRKGLRYLLSVVPTSFFSAVLLLIPLVLVGLAIAFTLYVKENVLEHRINSLQELKSTPGISVIEIYEIDKKIDRLNYYISFPATIVTDNANRKQINYEIENIERKINEQRDILTLTASEQDKKAKDLREQINNLQNESPASVRETKRRVLEIALKKTETDRVEAGNAAKLQIDKYGMDIKYLKSMKRNLPVSFFFVVVWVSLFGGLVFAFRIAYMGNVYYGMYTLKEDGKPTFYRNLLDEIRKSDKKQPLLGFTLLVIAIAVILLILNYYEIISLF